MTTTIEWITKLSPGEEFCDFDMEWKRDNAAAQLDVVREDDGTYTVTVDTLDCLYVGVNEVHREEHRMVTTGQVARFVSENLKSVNW